MAESKHPEWLRVKVRHTERFVTMRRLVATHRLHTVCDSANCPNIGECWGRGTATFLLLGNRCTRQCRFCDVSPGQPEPLDADEPQRVAEAVRILALRHAVLTSVTRDDLPDGGAALWAETIRQVRRSNPACRLEVLIPDFQGSAAALALVLAAQPDIVGHNVETVPRLYPLVRPQADYQRSLTLLQRAKAAAVVTKSGMMLGLGETIAEIHAVLHALRAVGCDMLTLGQYLCPTPAHAPLARYVTPAEFAQLRQTAEEIGFRQVASQPLVRSSYHAEDDATALDGHDAG